MQRIFKRLGKLGFVGVGGMFLSVAYNGVTAFYPLTNYSIPEEWARIGFWASICIGCIGFVCFILALMFHKEIPEQNIIIAFPKIELKNISLALIQMDNRLNELMHTQGKRCFNPIRYLLVNLALNKTMNVELPQKRINDITEAREAVSKITQTVGDHVKDILPDYDKLITDLRAKSSYLESKNYGLKKQRETDSLYKPLKNQVELFLATISDEELDSMVSDHILFSESMANLMLVKERGLRMFTFAHWRIYRVGDLLTTEQHIQLEQVEENIKNFLHEIRTMINKRVKTIEKKERGKT